jgi:hypothetical protein
MKPRPVHELTSEALLVQESAPAPSPWRQGLAWGASAWLVYVTLRSAASALVPVLGRAFWYLVLPWRSSAAPFMTAIWLAALALVAARSRWSRAMVAVAICAQAVVGTTEAAAYGEPFDLFFTLRFFVPMTLPLLPLVLFAAPRWFQARALLFGAGAWRAVLAAATLISLNHAAVALFSNLSRGAAVYSTEAWAVPALAFALGAVIASGRRLTRAAGTTW